MRQQGRWRNPAPALVPAANLSLAASLIILLHRVLSSLYSSTQVDEFFPTFFRIVVSLEEQKRPFPFYLDETSRGVAKKKLLACVLVKS